MGNTDAATASRQRALDAYFAYRRAGGASQSAVARVYTLVTQSLTTQQPTAAATVLAEITQSTDLPDAAKALLAALHALLAGSRDPALADDPRLPYHDAAELRLLLDQLAPA